MGQAGVTLPEVLMAVLITAMVIAPLSAWFVASMRTGANVRRTSAASAVERQLAVRLARDVAPASAARVATSTGPLSGCPRPGVTWLVELETPTGIEDQVRRTAYGVEHPGSRVGDRLLRAQCRAGTLHKVDVVADGVVAPSAGWTGAASCRASCVTVDLVLGLADGTTRTFTATRRVVAA